jgi:tetratricopeptide (TPR) repeat protein
MGMMAANDGKFEEAEMKLILALACARSENRKCMYASVLNSIGILYAMKGLWDNALLCYNHALSIADGVVSRKHYLYKTIQKNICTLLTFGGK